MGFAVKKSKVHPYITWGKRVCGGRSIIEGTRIPITKGLNHSGIILSKQLPVGTMVNALLKLLPDITPEKAKNNVIWLQV